MICNFYVNNDNDNVIDKTLTDKSEDINILFLEIVNSINPKIKIKKTNFDDKYNYCYFDNTYYFIRNKDYFSNEIVILYLEKDFLKSYESTLINNGYGEIFSSENLINAKKVIMDTNDTLEVLRTIEIENPFTEKDDVLISVFGNTIN